MSFRFLLHGEGADDDMAFPPLSVIPMVYQDILPFHQSSVSKLKDIFIASNRF